MNLEPITSKLPDVPEKWERGQVGIGTLIVFIAMVLVAAIAAGVLIGTAGELQGKSSQTGDESQDQVTNRINVVDTYGTIHNLHEAASYSEGDPWYVSSVGDGDDTNNNYLVDQLDFVMMRNSGSDNIQLDTVVLMWQGPDGAEQITLADSQVTINNIDGAVDGVLNENSDRARVTLTLNPSATDPDGDGTFEQATAFDALQTGEDVTVKFTTSAGATVTKSVSVPSTYENTDGAVIGL